MLGSEQINPLSQSVVYFCLIRLLRSSSYTLNIHAQQIQTRELDSPHMQIFRPCPIQRSTLVFVQIGVPISSPCIPFLYGAKRSKLGN